MIKFNCHPIEDDNDDGRSSVSSIHHCIICSAGASGILPKEKKGKKITENYKQRGFDPSLSTPHRVGLDQKIEEFIFRGILFEFISSRGDIVHVVTVTDTRAPGQMECDA